MFKPASMKRFYLAVPVEREEEVLQKIGELGAAQLTREIPVRQVEKTETVELYRKFMRLYERMSTVLGKDTQKERENPSQFSFDAVKSLVNEVEVKLDDSIKNIENLENEIKSLKLAEERLEFLDKYELKLDEVGDFKHIFVKAGFLNNALVPKLDAYTSGTNVVYAAKPGRPGECFVVVTGLNEDKPFTDSTLRLLNFDEFAFPDGLNPEPKSALGEVQNRADQREKEIQRAKDSLRELKKEFDAYEPHVSNALQIEEIKGSVARTGKRSLIHGWIPSKKEALLGTQVEEVVPKENIYLRFENPHREDKVPVESRMRGIFQAFEIFTNLQGTPNYYEINPTPIYTILYLVMFGMMFGDIGGGASFLIIGTLLTRLKKGFLVFSRTTARKLGQIIISTGLSAIIFGFLYGEFFLVEVFPPLLFSPLQDISSIILIALVFGVAQIILALVLNIINMVRRKEPLKSIFGGRGLFALAFYLSGINLAIAFFGRMSFGVFLESAILPFTLIALASLAIIFLSPLIESRLGRKKAKPMEKLLEGFGEGLETFIAFIANSVSYIRLAAFAIAHGALALAAEIFASVIGNIPALLLMNVIVFLVEGFAAYIQSLRLMYYEFSTKFYAGDGTVYKPFKTKRVEKI